MKVVSLQQEAPSRLLQSHSEARLRLAKLIKERLSAEEKIRHSEQALRLLRDEQAFERQAVADLHALDQVETARMADWSRNPEGPAPESDVSRRAELESKLRHAAAKANVARQAETAIHADLRRENEELDALEPKILTAIAAVIADETMGSLLDDLKRAVAAAVEKQTRLRAAVAAVFKIANDGPVGQMKTAFEIGETLDDNLRKAAAPPPPDSMPALAGWLKLAADLRANPLAELS